MRKPNTEILVATRNRGKILEIQEALALLPVKLRYLSEFDDVSTVEEVGQTYEDNAVLKALGYSRQTGVCALADDSGLEVDSLGGKPGVLSARFGGDGTSDYQRIEKLLTALSAGNQKRSARFVCCMALAGWRSNDHHARGDEPQIFKVTRAKCEGVMATSVRGENGFGYDPIFVPAGYDLTFGELPSQIKSTISHRALALAAMREFLRHWLASA
jgi:XTP/dITP diphosphohydrolase